MTLGGCVVKGLLPRMMLLWRNAFPRNVKELESEKARGDGFTWKMSLEARAGALASIHSFLQVCFSLKLYNISEICQNPINSAIWYRIRMKSMVTPQILFDSRKFDCPQM